MFSKLGFITIVWMSLTIMGCSTYSEKPQTTVLPTSNRAIDVVLHRSDIRFMDCGTVTVIQTFDSVGRLVDSKSAQGRALHCEVIGAGIQAGGMIGAAAVLRPSRTNIDNNNEQNQGQNQGQTQHQGQVQGQLQGQMQKVINTNVNSNSNTNNNSNTNSNNNSNVNSNTNSFSGGSSSSSNDDHGGGSHGDH